MKEKQSEANYTSIHTQEAIDPEYSAFPASFT
jgi:hypothetical protein